MKVAILAGGVGSPFAEGAEIKPKPMIEIGGRPILWHIMQHYAHYGHEEFIIALGHKGDSVKRYMIDYGMSETNLTVDLGTGDVLRHGSRRPDWSIELLDTGLDTQTGGRIKRLRPQLGGSTFMLSWGDAVADVKLDELLAFHKSHGKLATVTAVRPPPRARHVVFDGDRVREFSVTPPPSEGWINGAFYVLDEGIFDYIDGDQSLWEMESVDRLAHDGQLMAYRHDGFWMSVDTPRDQRLLEALWKSGNPPWKSWD